MHNFNYFTWRERKSQDFNREEITLTKASKTFNVYDKIQEAREDTEIYPTLEKYGCIDRMIINAPDVYADFTQFKGLREIKDQQKMAQNMFYNLPVETREVFNNDINVFMKDGEKYIKKLMEEQTLEKTELAKEQGTISKNEKTEINNG